MFEVDGIMMCGSRFCTNYTTIKQDAPNEEIIYHREVMLRMKKTKDRVKYLLETKPKTRNYDDWDFLNFYWEYLLGFTRGMEWTDFWKMQIRKFAIPETVRRSHQQICEPELAEFKAMLQNYDENRTTMLDDSYKEAVTAILKKCTYLPTDLELLKSKLGKESAILEHVIMEKIEA